MFKYLLFFIYTLQQNANFPLIIYIYSWRQSKSRHLSQSNKNALRSGKVKEIFIGRWGCLTIMNFCSFKFWVKQINMYKKKQKKRTFSFTLSLSFSLFQFLRSASISIYFFLSYYFLLFGTALNLFWHRTLRALNIKYYKKYLFIATYICSKYIKKAVRGLMKSQKKKCFS